MKKVLCPLHRCVWLFSKRPVIRKIAAQNFSAFSLFFCLKSVDFFCFFCFCVPNKINYLHWTATTTTTTTIVTYVYIVLYGVGGRISSCLPSGRSVRVDEKGNLAAKSVVKNIRRSVGTIRARLPDAFETYFTRVVADRT